VLGGGNGSQRATWVPAGFLAQVSAWLGLFGCWRAWASGYSGAGGLGLWARALAGRGFGLGLAGAGIRVLVGSIRNRNDVSIAIATVSPIAMRRLAIADSMGEATATAELAMKIFSLTNPNL
jgi:hypothetical protein